MNQEGHFYSFTMEQWSGCFLTSANKARRALANKRRACAKEREKEKKKKRGETRGGRAAPLRTGPVGGNIELK